MATQTPNLNLKKPAGTDYVRVGDFNDNADKLDVSIGDLGQLTTDAKASLVLAINEAALRGGENAPFIDVDTLHWMMWDVETAQYVDSGVKAEGADGSAGADGISAFVWIKWSAIQPTQNSDMKDTPDQFIGVYSGTSPTAPTAYTSYQWYKYKGDKGDVGNPGTGNNWHVGTAITGTSTTPSVYATGITNAQVGDMYLNNGELPDTGRAYVCTLGGNAATALWKYSCLLRGADGNGIGDMLKYVYDADNNGIVDMAESVIDGAISTAKLENNAVTNAKSAKMAAYTLKGNNTDAESDPQDITAANVRSMIDAQETMQYTAMPETVTNGTIIQYIGETTIVAPIYTNGHFYRGIDGAWQEIVYGDPNSVSYDAQSKTVTQKAQARTNVGAADVAAFSAHYTNGVVDGLGLGTPATAIGNVDVAEGLKQSLSDAAGTVHDNMLINGWFRINQRGTTAAQTAAGYHTDMWYLVSGSYTHAANGAFTLNGEMLQRFEKWQVANGAKLTVSVKVGGVVYSGILTYDPSANSNAVTLSPGMTAWLVNGTNFKELHIKTTSATVITAVKLEKGEASTLAADVAPDMSVERLRCQRYYLSYSAENNTVYMINFATAGDYFIFAMFYYLVPMRSTPTLDAEWFVIYDPAQNTNHNLIEESSGVYIKNVQLRFKLLSSYGMTLELNKTYNCTGRFSLNAELD